MKRSVCRTTARAALGASLLALGLSVSLPAAASERSSKTECAGETKRVPVRQGGNPKFSEVRYKTVCEGERIAQKKPDDSDKKKRSE